MRLPRTENLGAARAGRYERPGQAGAGADVTTDPIRRQPMANTTLRFDKATMLLSALLFSAGIILNFLNVTGRYLFATPIYWAEEVMILLVIWSVFLVGFHLTLQGDHLKTDLLRVFLSPRWRRWMAVCLLAVEGAVALFLAYHASTIVAMVARFGQVTPVAEIPKWISFGSVLSGFLLIAMASLIRMARFIRSADEIG